jgi:hypothetical protein
MPDTHATIVFSRAHLVCTKNASSLKANKRLYRNEDNDILYKLFPIKQTHQIKCIIAILHKYMPSSRNLSKMIKDKT